MLHRWKTTLSLVLALSLYGCATTAALEPPGELLVQGRLENLDYESLNDPDDLLGHGWITARLHVSRVLRGSIAAPVISVRYFAHTQLLGRAGATYRLHRDEKGAYFTCGPRGGTGYRCP